MQPETVTITKREYEELLDDAFFLNCLRNNGVDNWDGWDFACEDYHSQKED
jgi:hypothetical protein